MSAELWNDPNVKSPPIVSLINTKMSNEMAIKFGVLVKQTTYLEKYIKLLNEEWTIIKKVIQQLKRAYRSNHAFHKTKQIDQTLSYFFQLDAISFMTKFHNSTVFMSTNTSMPEYLPSKEMALYLLLRFQTLAKLLERLIHLSFAAGRMLNGIFERGHVNISSVTLFSLISRIWYVSKYIFNEVVVLYPYLLSFVNFLPSTNVNWLLKTYKFPYDLRKWIANDPAAFETPESIPVLTLDEDISFVDLLTISDDDSDEDDDGIQIVKELFGANSSYVNLVSDESADSDDNNQSVLYID